MRELAQSAQLQAILQLRSFAAQVPVEMKTVWRYIKRLRACPRSTKIPTWTTSVTVVMMSGCLFVDGSGKYQLALAELPAGGTSLIDISVSQSIGNPGQVQWDG